MPARAKTNVLFVNDHLGYPDGTWHGVTRYFVNVVPRIDRGRFEVGACFLRSWHPAAEALEAVGVRPKFLDRHRLDPRVLIDLTRLIRQRQLDVLHLCGMGGTFFGRIAARWTGCRAVVQFHEESLMPEWVALMQRRVATSTDWAFAVSDAVREWCMRRFAVPAELFETLPNGVPIAEFAISGERGVRARRELGLSESSCVIVILGRMSWEKGHRSLLEAVRRLRPEQPDLVLLVVGDGELRGELEDLTREWNLTDCVRFLGFRDDVPDLLAASDLCVMPSLNEGMPFALLEVLAAGVPLVATNIGGLGELLVDEETAMLVPPNQPPALAEAIRRMLAEPMLARRLAEHGRKCVERFSIARHVRRLEEVYENLVSQTRNGFANSSGIPQQRDATTP